MIDHAQKERNIFSANLRYYMEQSKKNQVDLANDLGVTSSTVSDWVNAKKYPRVDKMQMIADYLGILISDLREEKATFPSESPNITVIPVFGSVQAGIPLDAIEEILDYEEISSDMASQGEYFALQVQGDSMEPRIKEGDVVIVRKQADVESGETAIVLVNGNDATIKKIKKGSEGIILVPNNSSYEPMFYSNQDIHSLPILILGKVVELRGKL